jgi:hypothetical protein
MNTFLLKFRFDYGAGGCLWAGNDFTRDHLGLGPLDAAIFNLEGEISRGPRLPLSSTTHALIDELDFLHSGYLNPKYPPDPSLWSQALCNRFNDGIEQLFLLLQSELKPDFGVLDQQVRYTEDAALTEYLSANPELSAMDNVSKPSVH